VERKKEIKIFRKYTDIKNTMQKLRFKRKHMKKSSLIAAFLIINLYFTFLLSPPVFANEELKSYETNCCTIQYFDEEDLKKFALRIGAIKYTGKGIDDNPSNIKTRINEIMKKVQTSLDMYTSDLSLSIILYPDYNSLARVFKQHTRKGSVNTFTYSVPLAFYSHKTKTIHVDVSSITDGVLAHEMAHGVINFYFKTPPPAKMQEILAQYVDLHLWD
jgi:hypothetical protein